MPDHTESTIRELTGRELEVAFCLLVLGDDRPLFGGSDDPPDRTTFWRAVALAFLISALASATFIGVTALVASLDRATE